MSIQPPPGPQGVALPLMSEQWVQARHGPAGDWKVWTNPQGTIHNIVALSSRRLCVGRVEQGRLEEARKHIAAGGELQTLANTGVVDIELIYIRTVRAAIEAATLYVEYERGATSAGTQTIVFANPKDQEDAQLALYERLSPNAVVHKRVGSRLLHAFWQLQGAAFFLLLAALFHFVAISCFDMDKKFGEIDEKPLKAYVATFILGPVLWTAVVFGLGVVSLLLLFVGYYQTILMFCALSAVALGWAFWRACRPPVTVEILVGSH